MLREGALIGWLLLGVYLILALSSYSVNDPGWSSTGTGQPLKNIAGPTGAWIADVFFSLFGYIAYLFPVMIAYRVCRVFMEPNRELSLNTLMFLVRLVGLVLIVIAGTGLVSLQFGDQSADFRRADHLVEAGPLHVEDLAA